MHERRRSHIPCAFRLHLVEPEGWSTTLHTRYPLTSHTQFTHTLVKGTDKSYSRPLVNCGKTQHSLAATLLIHEIGKISLVLLFYMTAARPPGRYNRHAAAQSELWNSDTNLWYSSPDLGKYVVTWCKCHVSNPLRFVLTLCTVFRRLSIRGKKRLIYPLPIDFRFRINL